MSETIDTSATKEIATLVAEINRLRGSLQLVSYAHDALSRRFEAMQQSRDHWRMMADVNKHKALHFDTLERTTRHALESRDYFLERMGSTACRDSISSKVETSTLRDAITDAPNPEK